MFSANSFLGYGYSPSVFVLSVVLVTIMFGGSFLGLSGEKEYSHYLVSESGGYGYLFFCLLVLLGFSLVSLICFSRGSFFR